jgi:hypothetical protein
MEKKTSRGATVSRLGRAQVAHPQFKQCFEVIQGAGGLRKVRWSAPGSGKRGGVPVIYFHVAADAQVRLLLIYHKGVKDDLTAAEKRTFRRLNQDR